MGRIFKVTSPLPSGAETYSRGGRRFARWRGRGGKMREAAVVVGQDGRRRIETGTVFKARYRDGTGVVREVSTGCKTRESAARVLMELERQAERVRSGVTTAADEVRAELGRLPLADHFAGYLAHLRAKGATEKHIGEVGRRLERMAEGCRWGCLADLDASRLEHWLNQKSVEGASGRTRNAFRESALAFATWAVRNGRLPTNPFAYLAKADARVDRRKERRALSRDEAERLLRAAESRPVAEYGRPVLRREDAQSRSNRRSRRTWERAPLTWEQIETATAKGRESLKPAALAALERRGRQRRLVYLLALATGMRRGELRNLAVNWLQDIEGPAPAIVLRASDEKARRGAVIPLRADVAAELRTWLAEKAALRGEKGPDVLPFRPAGRKPRRAAGRAAGAAGGLADDALVFDAVPSMRAFDLDLQAAGIPKVDGRGRSLDFHALRTTFGTWLTTAGVHPRVAMQAMRHSKLELTMSVYTDPHLLDVVSAVEALPALGSKTAGASADGPATGKDAAAR